MLQDTHHRSLYPVHAIGEDGIAMQSPGIGAATLEITKTVWFASVGRGKARRPLHYLMTGLESH
jgi:hypothetical protein